MGIRARSSFPGAWLDLSSLIEETKYDLSDFDPALVNFYKIQGEGQLGIPFAVFPSFLFVNTDLFEQAGIPLPPTKYGESYVDKDGNKKEWNTDTLREVAMQLTFDKSGKNATEEGFNADEIVQFGFGQQYTDIRGQLTMFGAGNFVDANGKAQFPDNWKEGAKWIQQGMWTDHFYPTKTYGDSDILNKGNWFESGNIAMDQVHTWYTCCFTGLKAKWNIFPMPSYKGKVTAKLHADTFGILKGSKNQKQAFEVLTYLLGEKANDLASLYGGMPARLSLQKTFFAALKDADPYKGNDINMDVITESLKYNDNPNHEEGMPNFLESSARYGKFSDSFGTDPKFDLEAGEAELVKDLQALFDVKK
jgi:multiple sugar transport system substrate-binding protein